MALITGTESFDYLDGTDEPDLIRGLAGLDRIAGFGGNDTIYGGPDGDSINGLEGDDLIFGGAGGDVIEGFLGNDTMYGNRGPNQFSMWTTFGDNDVIICRAVPENYGVNDVFTIDQITGFEPDFDRIILRLDRGDTFQVVPHSFSSTDIKIYDQSGFFEKGVYLYKITPDQLNSGNLSAEYVN